MPTHQLFPLKKLDNMKKLILLTFFAFSCFINSQVGIHTSNINDGVVLQVDHTNKGVLFPLIPLESRISTLPLNRSIPTGTTVFNTSTKGNFPNNIYPGLHWWSAEDQQWTNISTNLSRALMKYTNSESSINYNNTFWETARLFGNKIINESTGIYQVNTSSHTVTIKKSGLYMISSLLSLDRLSDEDEGSVSLSMRVFVNNIGVGTEQVVNPGYTASIDDDRGLFSHSFTEFLELNSGDIVSVKVKRTPGNTKGFGTSSVKFLRSGDSSIAIQRIR